MNVQVLDARSSVRASLNYIVRTGEKPYAYTFPPPPGVAARSATIDTVDGVHIHDARPLADRLSLDLQGFVLRRNATTVRDFYDDDHLRAVYYPEVERLLKTETGAEKIVIFDHTIRSLPKFKAGKALKEAVN